MPGVAEPFEAGSPELSGLRRCRVEGFPNHVICYRPIDDGIEVIRVLHAAGDIDALLDPGDPPE